MRVSPFPFRHVDDVVATSGEHRIRFLHNARAQISTSAPSIHLALVSIRCSCRLYLRRYPPSPLARSPLSLRCVRNTTTSNEQVGQIIYKYIAYPRCSWDVQNLAEAPQLAGIGFLSAVFHLYSRLTVVHSIWQVMYRPTWSQLPVVEKQRRTGKRD